MNSDNAWSGASWLVGFLVFIGVSYCAEQAILWVITELFMDDVAKNYGAPVPQSTQHGVSLLVGAAIGLVAARFAGEKMNSTG